MESLVQELLARNKDLLSILVGVWMVNGLIAVILANIWGVIRDFNVARERKTGPLVVPPDVAAWTVRRDSRWMKIYHFVWGAYPRDICSYFWRSLYTFVAAVSVSAFVLGLIAVILFFLAIVIVSMTEFLMWLLGFITAIPSALAGLARFFVGAFAEGGQYAATSPTGHKIAGIVLLITLLVLFYRSRAGKVTRLRIKAWKNKYCPLIRVE